jgi:hypothetical protein
VFRYGDKLQGSLLSDLGQESNPVQANCKKWTKNVQGAARGRAG